MQYLTSQHQVTPARSIYGSGAIETQILIGRDDVVALAANDIYAHHTEAGDAPLGYDPWIRVSSTPVDYYSKSLSGTQEERDSAANEQTRQQWSDAIDGQRVASEQSQVDWSRDPGLQVVLDEANAAAEVKIAELEIAVAADLDSFDPTLHLDDVGAVATARSLVRQESRALVEDASLDADDRAELELAIAAHQAVVDAGDDAAEVASVPLSVRQAIGVVGEDYGIMIARRVNEAGWWWLTFELRTERELTPGDYWIAVYDDAGTYLTTPQLTQTEPGVYVADRVAVNLPSADTAPWYEFTLCFQHISNEQFKRKRILGGQEFVRYRARWGGKAGSGGAGGGTTWVDSGATVIAQAGQLYRISDAAVAAALTPGQQIKFTETGAETTFTGVWAGGADYVEINPFVQAATGDALWMPE